MWLGAPNVKGKRERGNYHIYCRGFPISSVYVLECSFHVGYKWVLANVSMTCGKFGGQNNQFGSE